MTDADYADDLVLLANKPAQPETTRGIGFHVNAYKADGAISWLKWQAFKISWPVHILW